MIEAALSFNSIITDFFTVGSPDKEVLKFPTIIVDLSILIENALGIFKNGCFPSSLAINMWRFSPHCFTIRI